MHRKNEVHSFAMILCRKAIELALQPVALHG
jgi:hypothetical protein